MGHLACMPNIWANKVRYATHLHGTFQIPLAWSQKESEQTPVRRSRWPSLKA